MSRNSAGPDKGDRIERKFDMAKKHRTGNREAKKPKKIKPQEREVTSIGQMLKGSSGRKA